MALETAPYDVAEFLDSDEMVVAYLSEELSSNDPLYMAKALSAVARARGGLDKLAEISNVPEDDLRRASDKDHLDAVLTTKVTQELVSRFSSSRAA
jgi:probable addiction module antidote protein